MYLYLCFCVCVCACVWWAGRGRGKKTMKNLSKIVQKSTKNRPKSNQKRVQNRPPEHLPRPVRHGAAPGRLLGASWGGLGRILALLMAILGRLFFFHGLLGASWDRPGVVLDPLGRSPDAPGDPLDGSWCLLGLPLATSGASRCDLTRKSKIKPSLQ